MDRGQDGADAGRDARRRETTIRIERAARESTPLPTTAVRILEIVRDPAVAAGNVAKAINLDPTLTLQILKLINSAFFNTPREVTSVKMAVVMLGLNTVKKLALSVAVAGSFSGETLKKYGLDVERYWQHCVAVAIGAKALGKAVGVDRAHIEDFFIAGLLHDIGKLIISNAAGEDYKAMLTRLDPETSDVHSEAEYLGIDHERVGEMLCEQWGLPDSYKAGIAHHHEPLTEGEYATLSRCVYLANLYAQRMGFTDRDDKPELPVDLEVIEALGMTPEGVDDALAGLADEMANASQFLNSLTGHS